MTSQFTFPLESESALVDFGDTSIRVADLPALQTLAPGRLMNDLPLNALAKGELSFSDSRGVALVDSCVTEIALREIQFQAPRFWQAARALRCLFPSHAEGKKRGWNFTTLGLRRIFFLWNLRKEKHWTLAELELDQDGGSLLTYYDSLDIGYVLPRVARVAKFVVWLSGRDRYRMRRVCHTFGPEAQQRDGDSCGAFAYSVLFARLRGAPLAEVTRAQVLRDRRFALYYLFEASEVPRYDMAALEQDPLYRALDQYVYGGRKRAKPFICPIEGCNVGFDTMMTLQRHLKDH